jgi:hypothetical protein
MASSSPLVPSSSHHHLTTEEVFLIGYYAGAGHSGRQIAKLLNRDQSTIARTITNYAPKPVPEVPPPPPPAEFAMVHQKSPLDYLSRSVPKKKTFLQHYLIYILLTVPTLSLRKIAERMAAQHFPFAVGKTQIGTELADMHVRSIRQIPRPWMTKVNREYRLRFVEDIRTDFRILFPWLFSDEASISVNQNCLRVWRLPGLLDNETVYTEKQQFPTRIMVWGAIARNYKSPLVRVEGMLNSDAYTRLIAESGIIESMNSQFGTNAWVFQDDGASAHRAKKTRAFLAERCMTLSSDLHWPAHSPDLSPIENLWGILKRDIPVSKCGNADQLWNAAQEVWDAIPMETVNELIDSVDRRLRSVAALDGQSLNGHRNVQIMVKAGQSVETIRALRAAEEELIQTFIENSQQLFEHESWEDENAIRLFEMSKQIIEKLPEAMRRKVRRMMPRTYKEEIEMV